MLIQEASKAANLTKKAIEYYTSQGFISPAILENGYRSFSEADVELLKRISVFRKIGLCSSDIKAALFDETGTVLQRLSVQKELDRQRESAKQEILDQLITGKNFLELEPMLYALEQSKKVTDKLLEAFPGYYGRFLCLHFARFLNEPVSTPQQQSAYEEIVMFLDEVPPLEFNEELLDFLTEHTSHISTQNIQQMLEQTRHSIDHPDQFLLENKEVLSWYLEYKRSEEYRNSPAFQIQEILQEFNRTSGYYDVFIPAMKQLSASYADYYQQLETANKTLLSELKDISALSTYRTI